MKPQERGLAEDLRFLLLEKIGARSDRHLVSGDEAVEIVNVIDGEEDAGAEAVRQWLMVVVIERIEHLDAGEVLIVFKPECHTVILH